MDCREQQLIDSDPYHPAPVPLNREALLDFNISADEMTTAYELMSV